MTKSKTISRFMKLFSVVLALVAMVSSVNIVSEAATSGCDNSRTITVITKANYYVPGASSITLKQTKGKYTYPVYNILGKIKKYKTGYAYGYYNVTCTPVNGTGKKKNYIFDSGSKKIKLDPNTTYNITVSYNWGMTWYGTNCKKGGSWDYTPEWRVSSSWKVTDYY